MSKKRQDSSQGTDQHSVIDSSHSKNPEDDGLDYSPIVVVAKLVSKVFSDLGLEGSPLFYEELSVFINHVYGTRNRTFHDVYHALEVGEGCAPIGKLAALFHDVVYIQVDRSRSPALRDCFNVFDPKEGLELKIPEEDVLTGDPWRVAITTLFGVKPGDTLKPFSGINEFLSAWVAIQKCRTHISNGDLLKLILCIEATVPFRTKTKEGLSIPEQSAVRLVAAAEVLGHVFTTDRKSVV